MAGNMAANCVTWSTKGFRSCEEFKTAGVPTGYRAKCVGEGRIHRTVGDVPKPCVVKNVCWVLGQ